MKLVLDWDEDTTDLVMIAVASLMLSMEEWTTASAREETRLLGKALKDLGQFEEDAPDGIYPVKELLGSHEVRLLKEDL